MNNEKILIPFKLLRDIRLEERELADLLRGFIVERLKAKILRASKKTQTGEFCSGGKTENVGCDGVQLDFFELGAGLELRKTRKKLVKHDAVTKTVFDAVLAIENSMLTEDVPF